MNPPDAGFLPGDGLRRAVEFLMNPPGGFAELPESFPEEGIGELAALEALAPNAIGGAADLGSPFAMAHMDPPTPWIAWAMALWNARLNQNLLHPATSPFAAVAESAVIRWLAPFFGMAGGHMCSGSTLANLTGLWAARDAGGAKRVAASAAAHVSVEKAARILGMPYDPVPTDHAGRLDAARLGDPAGACLVLTAGTTATGAIDPLEWAGSAAWIHADAAWAGPLRLCPSRANLLNGIERADSVAVSAHKWLFQPKDSALILFREPERANPAIQFGGGYLAAPNTGVQGSRGAAAIPLLATLLSWGRKGIEERIERSMALSERLADGILESGGFELWAPPVTGVTVFRSQRRDTADVLAKMPPGALSSCTIGNEAWLRSVAANPMADVDAILSALRRANE